MADITSIEINAKDQNEKTIKTTISYVNPNAQPSVLKNFAQRLNNLTNNTYESTTRIDKVNVDTATDKTARNPRVRYWHYGEGNQVEYDFDISQSSYTLPITVMNSDGKFAWEYVNTPPIPTDTARVFVYDCSTTGSKAISARAAGVEYSGYYNVVFNWLLAKEPQTLTFTVSLMETDTLQAWKKTFVINFIEEGGE